jgi:hypothetical protein
METKQGNLRKSRLSAEKWVAIGPSRYSFPITFSNHNNQLATFAELNISQAKSATRPPQRGESCATQ